MNSKLPDEARAGVDVDSETAVLQTARQTLDRLRSELLADRGSSSHWTGTLSPSALSTATAISALSIVCRESRELDQSALKRLIDGGTRWCLAAQNGDGGFGDTDRSYSNIATSMLVAAALRLANQVLDNEDDEFRTAIATCLQGVDNYIEDTGGINALRQRYGKDKTFVIPILTNCAIAGMVDWKDVQALPFELAAVPQSFYRWVRMPVVSYAVPALVAIGQARYFHRRPWFAPLRWLRGGLIQRTMRVLGQMQPDSGGYLEATPLTSFVLMSLASTGRADCEVARRAVTFLHMSVLEDGSWPIDTNLATWITSLSIHALGCDPADDLAWANSELVEWLLGCQHRQRHPFTGAEPGGWGWTDLSGAVPDGDDTPGAILALAVCGRNRDLDERLRQKMRQAAQDGAQWLLKLRNRDGGWPTFCRGWGKLPFDRSSTDLTAHSLRALTTAVESLSVSPNSMNGWNAAVRGGWRFLRRRQRADGSLLPLWFGNQDNSDDENPIYGTGRALMAARVVQLSSGRPKEQHNVGLVTDSMLDAEIMVRAADYLVGNQNPDGGWGGGISRTAWLEKSLESEKNVVPAGLPVTSSVEETAVAIEGLSQFLIGIPEELRRTKTADVNSTSSGNVPYRSVIIRGLRFLSDSVRDGKHQSPWPIGFYFAKLWYHERLYATVFSAAAIGTALRALENPPELSATEKDPRVVDPYAVRL